MLAAFIRLEIALFIVGAFYTLVNGREDRHWLILVIGGGLLFSLFYITIPIICIVDFIDNRK